ncbi:DUF4395 domain-containing protein [Marisediminicola antarctica]|uniref:DUF4395 domain-containing protein n=1 Tax=Marisediminicola antarctica TaxID=674079 RepID=UPI00192A6A98|nr:DUF4395 domain-containing protein [Marisediminicola antarctica]
MTELPSKRDPIDPRGPRFGAGITALLLLVVVALDLSGFTTSAAALLGAIAALFAWGAFAGIQRHPYGVLYARFVRPRLAPTSEREGAAPPTFAQGVGLAVTLVGLVLHLAGVPLAISIAAGAAFIAAFLNAAFAYCLGCQIYLGLLRAGLLGRSARV